MPCYDPPHPHEVLSKKVPSAVLCGIFRVLSEEEKHQLLSRVDWQQAGVTPQELDEWWLLHQQYDAMLNRR